MADLSLSLAAGEIVGLIGPNGAGKSTTFNLLRGLARPSAGRMTFLGATLPGGAVAAARRGIARSFQHVRLVPGMSVLENAALGAHGRGRGAAGDAAAGPGRGGAAVRRGASPARAGGAGGAGGAAGDGLALGQQRLAEIARALCLDPVLLLLDESAAGLRHAEKQALAAPLRCLREEGVTVLLVEHDMGFVMGLADRLVVMQFGTRLAEGTAEAIRADPTVIEAYLGAPA